MKKSIAFIGLLIIIAIIAFVATRPHAPTASNVITTADYLCDAGKTITATYYAGASTPAPAPGEPPVPGGSVGLVLSDGRMMTLTQTISADGARYANPDESFVFWSKGNGALVLENGQEKSFTGCIMLAPQPQGTDLPQTYANSTDGFSIRTPSGYATGKEYAYQELGPGKDIQGIKFTIAPSVASGTNLASDSYLSVEEIPHVSLCSATLFMSTQPSTSTSTLTDGDTTYSVASSTGAAAGNRYEETVYALPGTNPCIAVRYVVHYGVIENYPPGAVSQFDEAALLAQFDAIRRTLIIVQ